MAHVRSTLLFIALACALSASAWAQGYQVSKLEIPGCWETYPSGINEKRQIAFVCYDALGVQIGQGLWRTDWYEASPLPYDSGSWLGKVNQKRHVVGVYPDTVAQRLVGFKWQGAAISEVAYPGAGLTWPSGINDKNEMVGMTEGPSVSFAFLRTGTSTFTFHPIEPPFSHSSWASDVNNTQIVFGSQMSDVPWGFETQQGFIYNHAAKTFRTITLPGMLQTAVNGGNDKGHYTGTYELWPVSEVRQFGAYVWNGAQYLTLTPPVGYDHLSPQDINNRGEIVGHMWDHAAQVWVGFVAKPSAPAAVASR